MVYYWWQFILMENQPPFNLFEYYFKYKILIFNIDIYTLELYN